MTATEILSIELNAFKIKYPFIEDFKKNHRELINKIRDMLDSGKSLSKIKKTIRDDLTLLYATVTSGISSLVLEQYKLLKVDVEDKALVMGLNLKELIDSRINQHFKSLTNLTLNEFNGINKVKSTNLNATNSLTYNYLKASRENAYNILDKQDKPKGWLYSAILDRKTSVMCMGLNGKFYRYEDYKSRDRLPRIPNVNTHINCRSILLTIRDDSEIDKFKGKSLKEFLDSEPYEAKKLLGDKRYELYKSGKIDIENMINFKQNKFIPLKDLKA